jgi:hypothetical protein
MEVGGKKRGRDGEKVRRREGERESEIVLNQVRTKTIEKLLTVII